VVGKRMIHYATYFSTEKIYHSLNDTYLNIPARNKFSTQLITTSIHG
jgi:hypothetical protein